MPYSLKSTACIITLLLLLLPGTSLAADFTYEIYNPNDASADDYIISTRNVVRRVEGDFTYWYPSNSDQPNQIVFRFDFDQEVGSAYLSLAAYTFHWGTQAYTKIEGSKDGSTWVTLKETGPPATPSAFNNGTFSGNLPASLLGGQSLYFRVTLSVFWNDTPVGANTAQALRHRISTNSRTMLLEVDYKTSTKQTACVNLAVLHLLLDNDTVQGRTELIDPVAIGGAGTNLLYAGRWYSTPTKIVPNTLVGIEKDGQYSLYHPAMGTGISFSEETSKRAFLYTMLSFGSDYGEPVALAAPPATKLGLEVINPKHVELPCGVTAEVVDYGYIKLTNTLPRWAAVKLNYGNTSTTHYLAPYSFYFPDANKILKYVTNNLGILSPNGNEFSFNPENVQSFEIMGAAARSLPLHYAYGRPQYIEKALESDHDLFIRVCILDYYYVFHHTVKDIWSASETMTCGDAIIDFFAYQIERNIVSEFSEEQRLLDAIDFDSNNTLWADFAACASLLASGGALEVGYSVWDFFKMLGHFVENIPVGMSTELDHDAYTYVQMVDLYDLSIQTPPTKTNYVHGDTLQLAGTTLRATYTSSLYSDAITKDFSFDQTDFGDFEIEITPTLPATLSTTDTYVDFWTLEPDVRFLEFNEGRAIFGTTLGTNKTARQDITVANDGEVRPCTNPIIADSISIPAHQDDYNITMHFTSNHKMCIVEEADTTSMTGKVTKLYFYQSDGSGTYTTANPQGVAAAERATATLDTSYYKFYVSISPLPNYNDQTSTYTDPEYIINFYALNYSTDSISNTGDYLWFRIQKESTSRWNNSTIVNPEWLNPDGTVP